MDYFKICIITFTEPAYNFGHFVFLFYCEAIAQTLIGKLGVRGLARDISTMWQQEAATESTTFRLQENYTSL